MGNQVQYQYDLDRHVDLVDFGQDALGQEHLVDFDWDGPTGQLSSITSPAGTIEVGYTLGAVPLTTVKLGLARAATRARATSPRPACEFFRRIDEQLHAAAWSRP